MLSNLPKPAIIAHRGSSAYAPENTLAAFKLALEQGADGIELDVKLTADERIAVIHDQTVDRTTRMSGRVRDYFMVELQRMDAGSHFDSAFRGEPVPALESVLEEVGQLTFINVELTNYSSPFDQLPAKVVRLVRQYRLEQRVFFSSFNLINLIRVRRLFPEATIGLLVPPGQHGKPAYSLLQRIIRYNSLHSEVRDTSSDLVENAHNHGRKVFVYTVNQISEMQRLFSIGVDGIFTDDPILARSVLEKPPLSDFAKKSPAI